MASAKLKKQVARRLAAKARKDVDFAAIVAAMEAAGAAKQNAAVEAFHASHAAELGERIMAMVAKALDDAAETQAEQMLSDGTVTEQDLEAIL